MFFTSDVDVPNQLIDAQRAGKLVVFVGAGASVDRPSGLPLFPALTAEIARDALQSVPARLIREQPDIVLGTLDEEGIPVHQRVKDLIDRRDSQPNRLHHGIAGLFRSAAEVRIVTTNYDLHLETALRARWEEEIEVFRAPAMPLGHDFAGLVYLHGAISQDPRRLVATDEDFGRAYLNDAWAARFVHEMFTASTVLFIGYSHSDRVMTYLARGLPRDHHGRYALAPQSEDNPRLWRSLRIQPISYPLRRGNRPHLALTEAVEAWRSQSRMGLLDHAVLIKNISARNYPPSDPVTQSYLVEVITDPNRVAVFLEHASGTDWVDWVLQQDTARAIFRSEAILAPAQRGLAGWLAREVVADPDRFLNASQPLGSGLNPALWFDLAREVWRMQKPDPETVGMWVPLLLATAPANTSTLLDYILHGCEWPSDRTTALLLFDWLLEPCMSVGPWPQITLRGDTYWLQKTWSSLFRPNLIDCAASLMPMLFRHLETAHRLLTAAGRAGATWDSLSYGRSAIEPHEQDETLQVGIDVIIDACRDVLLILLTTDATAGAGYLGSLEQADPPLLRRLAVHGWAERSDISDDDRLNWLVNRQLVWDFPAKHEVFRLVRKSLPGATLATRRRLLSEVLRGRPTPEADAEPDPTHEDYLIYNYLVWLTTSDAGFGEAADALNAIRERQPTFEPREHPDMDHWMSSGFVGPRWPWKPEDLLQREPRDVLPDIMSYKDKANFFEPGWSDVCSLIADVVRRDSEWGIKLAAELGANGEWKSDLWSAVIQGWAAEPLTAGVWSGALDVLLGHQEPVAIRDAAAQLLEQSSRKPEGALPAEVLPKADALAKVLWDTTDPETSVEPTGSWLQAAINHWSGKLAEFWLHRIERLWRADPQGWSGLDGETSEVLGSALTGTEIKHAFARAVIAGQLEFVGAADLEWSVDHLLPLFDWERSAVEAAQAWDGFLVSGRWSQPLLPALMPLYLQSITHLDQDSSHERDRLFEHLASIALYGAVDQLGPSGWLDRAIAPADPQDRVRWAQWMGRTLKSAPPDVSSNAFEKWIERYWRRRLDGVPVPLAGEEGLEMTDWLLFAGDHFPAAVRLLEASPIGPSQSHRMYFRDLEESNIPSRYPRPTAALILSVLRSLTGPVYDAEHLQTVVRLLAAQLSDPAGRSALSNICGEAIRLGLTDADGWMDLPHAG